MLVARKTMHHHVPQHGQLMHVNHIPCLELTWEAERGLVGLEGRGFEPMRGRPALHSCTQGGM